MQETHNNKSKQYEVK